MSASFGNMARTGNKRFKDELERMLLRRLGRHSCMASNDGNNGRKDTHTLHVLSAASTRLAWG